MDSHEVSFIDFLAHLVERPTINQNVAGSNPAKIKCYPHFLILPFLERWYNRLTCRPVTPVLRVRVPYAPQTSSHGNGILRILAHLVEHKFWVLRVIGSTPVNTTMNPIRIFSCLMRQRCKWLHVCLPSRRFSGFDSRLPLNQIHVVAPRYSGRYEN